METTKILLISILALGLMVCLAKVSDAAEMGTAFTYQGHLYDNNDVADGLYDFQFALYDANSGGGQAGSDVNKPDVDVIDAYFTVELDFGGGVFDGNERWLEIGVRPGDQDDPCTYATLVPRQEVTPTPYALYAKTAGGDGDWTISGSDMYSAVSGNVGIGTTTPDEKLHVQGSGYEKIKVESTVSWGSATVSLNTNGGTFDYLQLYKGGPSTGGNIAGIPLANLSQVNAGSDAGPLMLRVITSNPMYFLTSNQERMRITADGNVGIGTTSPSVGLHLKDTENWGSALQLDASGLTGGQWWRIDSTANAHAEGGSKLLIRDTSGYHFAIDTNGNVGIGTTNPDAELHVDGQVKITGGSPGANKVLTSDASGLASWQTLPAGGDSDWTISDSNMYTGAGVTGNVGIGTNSPSEVLDVNGNININSVYKIDGATILSNAGTSNIFVGEGAGVSITSGYRNSAVGRDALRSNTGGSRNSAVGYQALYSNTYGHYNSAMGMYALFANTEGWGNSAMGYYALADNNEGVYNSAMGYAALADNNEGVYNSAMGAFALNSNTTGNRNSAMGAYALNANTTGVYNSAVGRSALRSNTIGNYNSAMGGLAGYSNETGNGNVFLGYKAGYFETGDNKLYIDNSDTSTPLIYGDFATNVLRINGWAYIANRLEVESDAYFSGEVGIGTTSPTGKLQVTGDEVRIGNAGTVNYTTSDGDLYVEDRLEVDGPIWVLDAYNFFIAAGRDVQVDSTGRFGYGASSKRYKENIAPLEDDFSKILAAQPVAFVWKESKESDIGLIAEDIDELGLRNLVIYDAEGRPASVRYKFLSLYLLEVLKEQVESMKDLKAENKQLKEQLKTENRLLNQRLAALETIVQHQFSIVKEVQQ